MELTPENAVAYLQETGRLPAGAAARAEALAWGVSNLVLRVTPAEGEAFVVKQSRLQLRTPDPWYSRLERVWREADAMRIIEPLLPAGVVPRVLFEDRENYLFAMEAAPADHVVWKQSLLEGRADRGIAEFLGDCLSALHARTAFRADLAQTLGDTGVFVELRVDPFYRRVAEVAPEARDTLHRLIDEMFATPICVVHADFSPKNVLVAGSQIVLVDYETAHYGDPAFDLGFFLSHLLLKTIYHRTRFNDFAGLTTAFWDHYLAGLQPLEHQQPFAPAELHRRTMAHLAGCMWARIDGTSKVDYLTSARDRDCVRDFCRSLLVAPPADWPQVLARLDRLTSENVDS